MFLPLLAACSGGPETLAEPVVVKGKTPDVVVITLDTTRADRLGSYGYAAAKTDTMDQLANAGIRFENAYSPLPLTIPSHATMFTGLHPYNHHIRNNGDNVLAPEFTTLAEILQQQGWAAGARSAPTWAWGLPWRTCSSSGRSRCSWATSSCSSPTA